MLKKNNDIRQAKGDVPNWMIADKMGVHEVTFMRWMRHEMDDEKKKKVFAAIKTIKNEMREALLNG